MMNLTVTPFALSEPPRELYSGHIPVHLISIEIYPAIDPAECRWCLTQLLRDNMPKDQRNVLLFRTRDLVTEQLRRLIVDVIQAVFEQPDLVIAGYRPASGSEADDYVLYRTRPNFPWDYAIPGYRARAS